MSNTQKEPSVRATVKASLPTLEQKLRARLRVRVVAMYDTATDFLNRRDAAAEERGQYGKAAGE